MNETLIKGILEQAVHAPSGDNAQPWRFRIDKNTLEIYNIPERDQSLYNFKQRASYIAHGALIENIAIVSSTKNLEPEVILLPTPDDPNHLATVVLTERHTTPNPLAAVITRRATNRKHYTGTPLTLEHRGALESIFKNESTFKLELTERREEVTALAKALSTNEQMVLENQNLHRFLFSHVLWTKKDIETKRNGMPVSTLELNPPQRFVFSLARHWWLTKLLVKIGLAKKVASDNGKVYASASAIGAITTTEDSNNPITLIKTGRLFQRLWLTSTQANMQMQPLTGILFLTRRLEAGDRASLTPRQTKLVTEAYQIIESKLEQTTGKIMMIFRIGYGDPPSAIAPRRVPEIL